jgi:hypothetical protein
MAPLTDPQILAGIKQVLQNWHVTDYVTWKDVARDWVGKHLEQVSLRDIARILYEHVQNGGSDRSSEGTTARVERSRLPL